MPNAFSYVLIGNPVSQACINALCSLARAIIDGEPLMENVSNDTSAETSGVWQFHGSISSIWIRLAGLSGASAIVIDAWGAHRTFPSGWDEINQDLKVILNTANRFHLINSSAFLAMPCVHRPILSGTLLFLLAPQCSAACTCYYSAISADLSYNRVALIEEITMLIAWLRLLF